MILAINQLTTNIITCYHDGDESKEEDFVFSLFTTDTMDIVVSLDKTELEQLKKQLNGL